MRSIYIVAGLLSLCCPQAACGLLDNLGNDIKNIFGGSGSGNTAPSPAASADAALGGTFVQLRNVNPYIAGPLWFKNADAAAYAYVAQNNMSLDSSLPNARRIPLSGGCVAVISYDSSNETANIAFSGPSSLQDSASKTTSTSGFQQVGFLSSMIPDAAVMPQILTIFNSAIGSGNTSSLMEEIDDLSMGMVPMRVVCTGFGIGGSLADLCGVWAAYQYPDTHVRVITFGAPFIGNNAYAYAHQQLVDLSYLWIPTNGASQISLLLPHDASNNSMSQSGSTAAALSNYTSVILTRSFQTQNVPALSIESTPTVTPNSSISDWLNIVDGVVAPTGNSVSSANAASYSPVSAPDIPIIPQDILSAYDFPDAINPDPGCPSVLCKVRGDAAAACGVYQLGNNTNATMFTMDVPNSKLVMGTSSGAVVAIAYNSSTKTALVSWRGTSSNQDWLEDAELFQEDYDFPNTYDLKDTFPGVQVHHGFNGQLQDVTTEATSTASNITYMLLQMMGNDTPIRIVVTGHSLGASVSSINSLAYSIQWPTADIHSTTIGSPLCGNQDWVDAFRGLVGRQYRIVNAHDQVPTLPPLSEYRHVGYGIWINNGTPLLQDRPYIDVKDTTWDNHTCGNYTGYLYNASQVYIPTFPLTVANAVYM